MDELVKLSEAFSRLVWQIVVATVCGGVIGLERRLRQSSPHIVFYLLVCLGSALVMSGSELSVVSAEGQGLSSINLFAALTLSLALFSVTLLVYYRNEPRNFGVSDVGLLWVTGIIGAFIGMGFALWGLFLMGVVVIIMSLVGVIEKRLSALKPPQLLRLNIKQDNTEVREMIRRKFDEVGAKIKSFRSEALPFGFKITLTIDVPSGKKERLLEYLWTLPEVLEVEA
ncbi:MAG: MgtC/SapB family protein [bacterium]